MSSAQAKSNHNSDSDSQLITKDGRLPINRYVLFFALLVGGLAADLITKSVFFDQNFDPDQRMQEPIWWIDGVFGLQTSTNGGALFGMGQGGSFWFATFSLVAILGILFWLFVRKNAHSLWLTITLGIISGGILGNFYDRIGWGYQTSWNKPEIRDHVRDWIHFRLNGVPMFDPWPNFNIADSLLVCGAILLFGFAIFGGPRKSKEESVDDNKD